MRFVPELLTRNWTLKLAALGIAVLLWTAVRVEAPDRQPLPDVPVRVQLDDPSYALAEEPSPATVQLRLGGPARALFQLALDPPSLVIPVDQVHTPDTTITLRRDWVRLQDRPGVVVEDIQPASVRLVFEPLDNAAVPLVATTTGRLSDDLALATRPSVNPPVIRVSGPLSRVSRLDSVPLHPVDLSGLGDPGGHRLEVAVDTTGLSGLSVSPTRATVLVTVDRRVERTIRGFPVTLETDAPDLEIEPRTLDVTLRGPRSLVQSTDSTSLALVVPAEALEGLEGSRRVAVQIRDLSEFVRASLSADSVLVRRRSSS